MAATKRIDFLCLKIISVCLSVPTTISLSLLLHHCQIPRPSCRHTPLLCSAVVLDLVPQQRYLSARHALEHFFNPWSSNFGPKYHSCHKLRRGGGLGLLAVAVKYGWR